jgi:hypothetical protein
MGCPTKATHFSFPTPQTTTPERLLLLTYINDLHLNTDYFHKMLTTSYRTLKTDY